MFVLWWLMLGGFGLVVLGLFVCSWVCVFLVACGWLLYTHLWLFIVFDFSIRFVFVVGLMLVIVVSSLVGCWFGLCLFGLACLLEVGCGFVLVFWLALCGFVLVGCLAVQLFVVVYWFTCSLTLFCFGCLVV